ncbi:MAG: 2-polyprenyl-3-methyl-6-methoxy-1,4-benzoquinone monooxygenase [Burkholderiaceae bacterium]
MELSLADRWLCGLEAALRTLTGTVRAERASPAHAPVHESATTASDAVAAGAGVLPSVSLASVDLTPEERRLSGSLMRVNHVGEVCAQALYQAQALATSNADLRAQMAHAAREEIDHLAWTRARIAELGDRPSLLNPLWFGGAFLIGLIAGRLGDRISLGFVVETERQVHAHLASHLGRLPRNDAASRAIVSRMQEDEAAHAAAAQRAGGIELPAVVRATMRLAARVMTTTAHHL